MLRFALVFAGQFCLDFLWAHYMTSLFLRRSLKAATFSATLVGIIGLNTWSYTKNPILILATVSGAFCGTFVVSRWGKLPEQTDGQY